MALKFHHFLVTLIRQGGGKGATEGAEKCLIYRSFCHAPDRSSSALGPSSGLFRRFRPIQGGDGACRCVFTLSEEVLMFASSSARLPENKARKAGHR
ncbi:protein of unknown function [Methylocaldum szegediense]|uniref:Secreted protein n=1 Tax=Methylocaldum szegediense TaxID=73780 RepID=A0ABM9HYS9_9GAMM|nr:protein of unknown function [Methylocaldum szegediense]